MTDLTPLIQALQEATGPSRELDARIWQAAHGFEHDPGFILETVWLDNKSVELPLYTASLDAITALIERELPGTCWSAGIHRASNPRRYTACLETDREYLIKRHPISASLALCIAFLSALQARGGANG